MCINKLKNFLLIRKKATTNKQDVVCESTTAQKIDAKINYENSYYCSYLHKRHMVLSFDIQNKSCEQVSIDAIEVWPCGKLVKNIVLPITNKSFGIKILPSSSDKKVSSTYFDKPFMIAANSYSVTQTIIVRDFNINSDLKLIIKSSEEEICKTIEANRILPKYID